MNEKRNHTAISTSQTATDAESERLEKRVKIEPGSVRNIDKLGQTSIPVSTTTSQAVVKPLNSTPKHTPPIPIRNVHPAHEVASNIGEKRSEIGKTRPAPLIQNQSKTQAPTMPQNLQRPQVVKETTDTKVMNQSPRLSNNICEDHTRSTSYSTLSSSDSSGKKEYSSISSISTPSSIQPQQSSAHTSNRNQVHTATGASTHTVSQQKSMSSTDSNGMGEKKHSPPPPLKSTKMVHLRKKYMSQLEYMHREFKKLEKQLLGAKSSSKSITESAGSKERREKLHSFIVHLEETMSQIQVGCDLEQEGKCTLGIAVTSSGGSMIANTTKCTSDANSSAGSQSSDLAVASATVNNEAKKEFARSSALTKMTKEKEEEENVQKLEEHILANLLPVKERLTKQLAAQQGAVRNPAGMPTRRGLQPPNSASQPKQISSGNGTTGVSSAVGSQVPGQVTGPTAHSQYGQPLKGGGSSLTQKLHGKTLGAQQKSGEQQISNPTNQGNAVRVQDGKTTIVSTTPRKVVYAGMTPGSNQVRSGVSAASGVHEMIIENARHMIEKRSDNTTEAAIPPPPPPLSKLPSVAARPAVVKSSVGASSVAKIPVVIPNLATARPIPTVSAVVNSKLPTQRSAPAVEPSVEQQRQRQVTSDPQQQIQRKQVTTTVHRVKPVARNSNTQRKGPRCVEYICALCNETYKSTCDSNPWWALANHECPKCGKTQIPRLDISAPANAIEYHPALLAHAVMEDGVKNSNKGSSVPSHSTVETSSGNQRKNSIGGEKDIFDSDSDDSRYDESTPSGKAAREDFGSNYDGPKFTPFDSSRLLTLMNHASSCPGRHKNEKQRNVCTSVKFMMLHVRDCPGTTPSRDVCPYPWCRKMKHLLYHLVSCSAGSGCKTCNSNELNGNLQALRGLNFHRIQTRRREFLKCQSISQQMKTQSCSRPANLTGPGNVSRNLTAQRKIIKAVVPVSETRGTKVNISSNHTSKVPILMAPKQRTSIKNSLSVPSPIPTTGVPSTTSKMTNSLAISDQPQRSSIPKYNPRIPPSKVIANNQAKVTAPVPSNIQSPTVNPLMNSSKKSSPPNPLKGLSVDSTPNTNAVATAFPNLPTQIDECSSSPPKAHNVIRTGTPIKIKIEGKQ